MSCYVMKHVSYHVISFECNAISMQNRRLYNIKYVMLYNICRVMLYNICHLMLYNISHVMLYNINYVML